MELTRRIIAREAESSKLRNDASTKGSLNSTANKAASEKACHVIERKSKGYYNRISYLIDNDFDGQDERYQRFRIDLQSSEFELGFFNARCGSVDL